MTITDTATVRDEVTVPDEPQAKTTPRRARIDGPHPTIAGEPASSSAGALLEVEQPTTDLLTAVAGQTIEARREQLELQAAQLAEHLRERLREVDRREAQLNARMAQAEADLRAGRVWQREQEHEAAGREAELRRQLEDLQGQAGSEDNPTAERVDVETLRGELVERQQQLELKEHDLRERRFEVDRQAAALRHSQQLWEQERSRQEAELARERARLGRDYAEQAAQRNAQLEAAEELVAAHAQHLERDRAELAADRQTWEERRCMQARELEGRVQTVQAEQHDLRLRIDARAEWVEQQKAGLEQVRSEIMALHRQTLELRLVAEQLWAQTSGRLAPAEVTHAIAHLRLKLAEHYRLEEQGLESRKVELTDLGERLAAQHCEVVQRQAGLKSWVTARQAEIESQAATLVEREQELDAQHDALRQARQEWQFERRGYEEQIRDLLGQLRQLPAAA